MSCPHLRQASRSWALGLNGASLDAEHPCRLAYHVSLLDIFPRRLTNFFTRSDRCVRHANFASIQMHKLVLNEVRMCDIFSHELHNDTHLNELSPPSRRHRQRLCKSILGRNVRQPSSADPLGDMYFNLHPDWWSRRSPENRAALGNVSTLVQSMKFTHPA